MDIKNSTLMVKKIMVILSIILVSFLSSCFNSDDKVNQAKKDMWIIEEDYNKENSWENISLEEKIWEETSTWETEEENKEEIEEWKETEEKELSEKIKQLSETISTENLPINSDFWNPIDLWNGKIWYSDLKWSEITKKDYSDLSCENLGNSLSDKINSWYYWNTCRPINIDKGLSFFIVRLDWDKYIYEKHYYIKDKWIYWTQELETWTWVTKENIEEKNKELKDKNENYPIIKISDKLFNEISK